MLTFWRSVCVLVHEYEKLTRKLATVIVHVLTQGVIAPPPMAA